jgi:putative ATPase
LKSNTAMAGLSRARADLEAKGSGSVPAHLRESHYPGAARLGHGAGYRYPHDYPGGWVDQRYLPPHVGDAIYYEPGERGAEAGIKERLAAIRDARREPGQGRPETTQKSGQRKS